VEEWKLPATPVRKMKRDFAKTRDGNVHYVLAGEGPSLVLLHETPRSWRMYAGMFRHLDAFRVIAPDTLGFGDSDKAPSDYSIAEYAANVVSFLDVLGVSRAHIFGDHTGAAIAVEIAIGAPERVDHLVLSGLPFWLNETERVMRHRQVVARDLISHIGDGSHLGAIWQYLLKSRIPAGGSGQIVPADMELLSEITLDALKAGPAWKQMELLMAMYDPAPRLPVVQAPTMAIGIKGEGASIYTKRPREVAALLPQGMARVIEHADGRVITTHAKEVSEIVTDFLRGPTA
jgi:pimeloyl-ACP methyl ester carboxylesterase